MVFPFLSNGVPPPSLTKTHRQANVASAYVVRWRGAFRRSLGDYLCEIVLRMRNMILLGGEETIYIFSFAKVHAGFFLGETAQEFISCLCYACGLLSNE